MICQNNKCEEYDSELKNCTFGSEYPKHCKICNLMFQMKEESYPNTPEEFIETRRMNKAALNSSVPYMEMIKVSDVHDMLRYYFHR